MSETAVTPTTTEPGRGDVDSNLALLGYALLFFSIFFAGMPGLVAAIIAYAQRQAVSPAIKSHYNFQIRIFWVGVVLSMIAAVSGVAAAAISVGQLFQLGVQGGWDAWDGISFSTSEFHVDPPVVTLLSITAFAALATVLWLLIAPLVGFIRLATQHSMSDRAA
ncbi:MAG: hypothetical protein ACM3YN_09180 [Parcubacteria group bacterium]